MHPTITQTVTSALLSSRLRPIFARLPLPESGSFVSSTPTPVIKANVAEFMARKRDMAILAGATLMKATNHRSTLRIDAAHPFEPSPTNSVNVKYYLNLTEHKTQRYRPSSSNPSNNHNPSFYFGFVIIRCHSLILL
ncbi:hypothetical protein F5887DRAFT_1285120 [Amanita rubescens]|nr:hypothetical protein F5887DRAFT_1285120 [Amanita rubescens]